MILLPPGQLILSSSVVEQVLAVAQLGPQRGQRPAHHGRGQVGDDPHRMRQVRAPGEGRPALVVDEEEGDAVGRQRLGHAQDPGLEELDPCSSSTGFSMASSSSFEREEMIRLCVAWELTPGT